MVELLSTYGLTVLVILLVGIPAIVNFISWCKNLWKKRQDFEDENRSKGREEQKKIAEEQAEATHIQKLDETIADLKKIIDKQQEQIDLLIKSDELEIKAWIKAQHEKWTALQCIDSQSLELVIARFDIYTEEGGNSWAERLVDEIKALPIVTAIPLHRG